MSDNDITEPNTDTTVTDSPAPTEPTSAVSAVLEPQSGPVLHAQAAAMATNTPGSIYLDCFVVNPNCFVGMGHDNSRASGIETADKDTGMQITITAAELPDDFVCLLGMSIYQTLPAGLTGAVIIGVPESTRSQVQFDELRDSWALFGIVRKVNDEVVMFTPFPEGWQFFADEAAAVAGASITMANLNEAGGSADTTDGDATPAPAEPTVAAAKSEI